VITGQQTPELQTPLPISLVHRSQRRPPLVAAGLLLVVAGLALMIWATQIAQVRALVCRRAASSGPTCELRLVWLGTTLSQTPLAGVTAAQVEAQNGGYRVILETAGSPIPFTPSDADQVSQQSLADQINQFLANQAETELDLSVGGAWQGILVGAFSTVVIAGGALLAIASYRRVQRPTHANTVWSVVFAADGRLLASGSLDQTIQLWHKTAEDGTFEHRLTLIGHHGSISCVCFIPAGQLLASASWDKTIRLWSVEDGALRQTLSGHIDVVSSLAAAPDGQLLASGSWDQTIRLWKLADQSQVAVLTGHEGGVESLVFTPDGTLCSGSTDGTARLWDVAERRCLRTLNHPEAVISLAASADGRYIATGSTDHLIRLWRAEDGALLRTCTGHTDWVRDLIFTADSQSLFSASTDGTIRLWRVEDGSLLQPLTSNGAEMTSLDLSADGKWLLTGSSDGLVRLWPIASLVAVGGKG
jgi:WD40 repeat protein